MSSWATALTVAVDVATNRLDEPSTCGLRQSLGLRVHAVRPCIPHNVQMRTWQMVTGWVMAVALASAVGFIAIALVGVGLDPLSGPSPSATGSIGALGSGVATSPPTDRPGSSSGQLPVVTPGPAISPRGAVAAPDDVSDSVGDSSPAASPRPSPVTSGGSGSSPRATTSQALTIARSVNTAGGSATARCTDDRIALSAWSPASGYSVNEVRAGPASSVQVKFESSSRRVEIKAECRSGVPSFEAESRPENRSSDD